MKSAIVDAFKNFIQSPIICKRILLSLLVMDLWDRIQSACRTRSLHELRQVLEDAQVSIDSKELQNILNEFKELDRPALHQLATVAYNDQVEDMMGLLMRSGANPNTTDAFGNAAVTTACIFGQQDAALYLLSRGAKIDVYQPGSNTCLIEAIRNGLDRVVDAILAYPDIEQILNVGSECGESPLHIACILGKEELALKLIDAGSRLDSLDKNQHSIVFECVQSKLNNVLNRVLQATGNTLVDISDQFGQTPLMVAISVGNFQAVEMLLLHNANILSISKQTGRSALHESCALGSESLVETLLQNDQVKNMINLPDNNGSTPFHLAVFSGDILLIKRLLDQGADPSIPFPNSRQCIHICCLQGLYEIVKLLVERSENQSNYVNKIDGNQCTPLFYACVGGFEDIALYLIEHGADVTYQKVQNNKISFCFHMAVRCNLYRVVQAMVFHGADALIEMTDFSKKTPLQLAVELKAFDSMACLLKHGADISKLMEESSLTSLNEQTVSYPTIIHDMISSKASSALFQFYIRCDMKLGIKTQCYQQKYWPAVGCFIDLEGSELWNALRENPPSVPICVSNVLLLRLFVIQSRRTQESIFSSMIRDLALVLQHFIHQEQST